VFVLAPAECFGQWTALGPYGGGIHVLAANPSRPDTLIAGTRNALLFVSVDSAQSWQKLAFPRSLLSTLNTLLVDHCDPNNILVGVTDTGDASGLYRSVDGGKTWAVVDGLKGEPVTALADAPYQCGTLAAGTMTGVMLSKDAGSTWQRISPVDHPGLRPVVSLAFEPGSKTTLYAGTPKLPWKTSDLGKTWVSVHVGISDDSDIFSIATLNERVLVGACSGVYQTTNAGLQWQKILGIPGTSQRTYVVKPDPGNHRTIYVGTSTGLWKSTDAGVTWARKSTQPIRAVTIDPRDSRKLFLASDDGVLKSLDGATTLIPSNRGLTSRKLEAFEDAGTTLLASTAYDVGSGSVFVSADDGHAWGSPASGPVLNEHIFTFTKNDRTVFAAGLRNVYRAGKLGKTWTLLTPPTKGSAITALLAIPNSQSLLLSTRDSLFLSKDDGTTWARVTSAPSVNLRLLRVSPDGKRWGFLSDDGLFVSSNGGKLWSRVQTPDSEGAVNDFALQGEASLLIGALRGLSYTTDGGRHWNSPAQGLGTGTVQSVLWHPYQTDLMYALQNGTPYVSVDGGSRWEELRTDEIGNDSILDLHWAADHSKVYAVTFARGLFVQSLSFASLPASRSSDR
jgi:photosystem II stability/assembly factor-like uncharacterized protein